MCGQEFQEQSLDFEEALASGTEVATILGLNSLADRLRDSGARATLAAKFLFHTSSDSSEVLLNGEIQRLVGLVKELMQEANAHQQQGSNQISQKEEAGVDVVPQEEAGVVDAPQEEAGVDDVSQEEAKLSHEEAQSSSPFSGFDRPSAPMQMSLSPSFSVPPSSGFVERFKNLNLSEVCKTIFLIYLYYVTQTAGAR